LTPLVLSLALLGGPPASGPAWTLLPALPDPLGVAGPFAGSSGGALLVAGGANFPGEPPWRGGTKAWHDRVYALDRPDGAWRLAGNLPRPLAYGVSASNGDGVVCVGGGDATRHHAEAFRLSWDGRRLTTAPLPALPRPLANACGAIVGGSLYVAGGQEAPGAAPSRRVYRIHLSTPDSRWIEIEPLPGPGRMLATAAAFDGAFWAIGGVDLVPARGAPARRYLADAYRHDPGKGWTRQPDLPYPLAASPSPAATDATGLRILGGDDGSKVGFTPPEDHPGFRRTILRLDRGAVAWRPAGEVPDARVTVPLVRWRGRWVIPSGEARPGVRSAQVWGGDLDDRE
jgi:N-acetylneuraminic acid mutarotase